MAIDLDVVTRLNRASVREAAREAQRTVAEAGENAGADFGDGVARGISAKSPEIEKSLKKVADASGKVIVEQEKLNALKESGNATDAKLIAQSERVARAYRDEEMAIRSANRAIEEHNTRNDSAVASTFSLTAALDNAGAAAGRFAGAFGAIGAVAAVGTLPAAAVAVAELGGALQQLSGAALAVPGIFAGIASSVGTAALGMQGMKDAFDAVIKASDGTEASVKAANEALAGLSPNAADAVTSVVGLKGTFEDLRNMASQNMFAGFSGGLRDLVSNSLPEITAGVDGISRGLNQNLTEVMASLGSNESQGFISRILGNTGDAQSKLTNAIKPMVNAVGVLTAAGSDTLPRLADAVAAVAERFNTFISGADQDGRLATWISQGLDGLTSLGESVLNIGKAFTGITEAAGGGQGFLPMLESLTAKFADFVNSTAGQNKIGDYFQQGRDILGQLVEVAKSAGPVLDGMFNGASSVASSFLPVVQDVLDVINAIPGGAEAVVTAFVAWQSIEAVSSIAEALGGMKDNLDGLSGDAAEAGDGLGSIGEKAGEISEVAAALIAAATAGEQLNTQIQKYLEDNHPRLAELNQTWTPDQWGKNARDWVDENFFGKPPAQDVGGPGSLSGGIPQTQLNAPASTRDSGGVPAPLPINAESTARNSGGLPTTYGVAGIGGLPGAQAERRGGTPDRSRSPLSEYSAPTVTEGGKGKDAVPTFDPSMYAVNAPARGVVSPLADPAKVYDAETREMTARSNFESARLALLELEAKGDATQRQLLDAKSAVQEKERAWNTAQRELIEAQNGTYKKANDSISGAMNDLKSIFAPMDEDFGISGGLPGIAKWLATFLGNFALAGAIKSDPNLQAAAIGLMSQNSSGQGGYGAGSVGVPGMLTGGGWGALVGGGQPYGLKAGTDIRQGASGFPDWVYQMGQAFGLTASTYAGHQEDKGQGNQGIDWWGPVENQQRFAEYLASIKGTPGLEDVIWQNPNTGQRVGVNQGRMVGTPGSADPGYFRNDFADHTDHVHTTQQQSLPLPGGFGAAGYNQSSGPVPVNVVGGPDGMMNGPAAWGADWNAIAQGESTGNWQANTGNGYFGGLQFKQSSWEGAGGTQYAPRADLATPYQQAMTAENLLAQQGPGAWPNTFVPGSSGPSPFPQYGVPASGGGAGGLPGTGMPEGPAFGAGPALQPNVGPAPLQPGGVGRSAGTQSLPQAAAGGGGGEGGIGLGGGAMDAAMAGTAALDMMAPGAGQAAKVGIQLANRAIKYGGQVAAIGVSGLMETFLPHNSALGDPGKSWLGKIAGGIAGARPAAPNQAGRMAPQQQQGQQGQGGNTTNDNRVVVEQMNTGGGDGQGVANDIGRAQYQQYMAGQQR